MRAVQAPSPLPAVPAFADGQDRRALSAKLGTPREELVAWRRAAESTWQHYRALFDLVPCASLITTWDGLILEVNRAAEQLFHLPGTRLQGRPFAVLLSRRDRVLVLQQSSALGETDAVLEFQANVQPRHGPSLAATLRVARLSLPERTGSYVLHWVVTPESPSIPPDRGICESCERLEARIRERTVALARVNAAERQARQVADTLRAASLSISRSLNLGEVLETLQDFLERLVQFDGVSILLIRKDARLIVKSTHGDERWTSLVRAAEVNSVAQANPLEEQIIATRASIRIDDTRDCADWLLREENARVRSWLGVPMVIGTGLIGVIALEKHEPNFFTKEQQELTEALGAQAAVSIQNAWLYEEMANARGNLQYLSRRLIEVQENERRHIARELHDEAGQALTSIIVALRLLERQAHNPERVLASVAALRHTVDEVLENLHRLAMDLMPASLDHLGLEGALYQHIASFREQTGLDVTFKVEGFESMRLAPDLETALYRFVQEALTNGARHAGARHVWVFLRRESSLVRITVQDDGVGFDAEAALRRGRLGLLGLRERTELLGGTMDIASRVGEGTTLTMEVPYGDSYTYRR
jgi:PAS domain S-box-containing protein